MLNRIKVSALCGLAIYGTVSVAAAADLKDGIASRIKASDWILVWKCPAVDVSTDYFSQGEALSEAETDQIVANIPRNKAVDDYPVPLTVKRMEAMLVMLRPPRIAKVNIYQNRVLSVACFK